MMNRADQFRPGPPPALNSAAYAREHNETKSLGGARTAARTAAQTDAVRFWTQANLPNVKREVKSINDMDLEHRNVRVWGGIHFRNSLDVGYDMGNQIAVYLIENSIKPVR